MINQSKEEVKKVYAEHVRAEKSLLRSLKIGESKTVDTNDEDVNTFYGISKTMDNDRVEYAVQVGVYKTSNVPHVLASLSPLRPEPTRNGLYRLMTAHYSLIQAADSSKKMAVQTGVKDAFIVAYKNGKRISLKDAHALSTKSSINSKMAASKPAASVSTKQSESVSPVTKTIVYKIQLGAFRQKLSGDKMNELKRKSSEDISSDVTASGLQIYYTGSFNDLNTAQTLRNTVVSKGIRDAFIVAFSNGKKISLTEAQSMLKR